MNDDAENVSGNGELYATPFKQLATYFAKWTVALKEPLIVPLVVSGLNVDVHR